MTWYSVSLLGYARPLGLAPAPRESEQSGASLCDTAGVVTSTLRAYVERYQRYICKKNLNPEYFWEKTSEQYFQI